MAFHHRVRPWRLVALQTALGFLADRNYRALPQLGPSAAQEEGHVAIVVPARNEEDRLPQLLASLRRLHYADVELVVVDDGSMDGTARIASSSGVRVIVSPGPPPGWTGKNHACWMGANATESEWLLFTDADTIHGPDSLGAALSLARSTRAGLTSLLARQRCESFWERVLLPYAYAVYFTGVVQANLYPSTAVANGQYMLFRRSEYDRIGGHGAVRSSIIEDVALARHARRLGATVILARGERHLSVRMYRNLREVWEGFSKNAVRFVTVSPRTGLPTVLAGIAMLNALRAAFAGPAGRARVPLLVLPAFSLLPWDRRFEVPLHYAFLYPLSALVFQLIAADSMRRALLKGGTRWKGRRY